MTFALAGNQNSGKTTLFNRLTGDNQHVGNWPGVTVERKAGELVGQPSVTIVDLPGMYSLRPYSREELVSRDFLARERPAAIIDCVDATNLERGLYLTLQLMGLGRPMVVALNMMDEVRRSGDEIDAPALERALGVPVVAISARSGEGVQEMIARVTDAAARAVKPAAPLAADAQAVQNALQQMVGVIEPKARLSGVPTAYAAMQLCAGDESVAEALGLSREELERCEAILTRMERACGMERAAAMADACYGRIEKVLAGCMRRAQSKKPSCTERIDGVLTHPVFAFPIFAAMLATVFWLTFGPLGQGASAWIGEVTERGGALLSTALRNWDVALWVRELLADGVFRGVGSVLRFLPTLVLLFGLLSLLEDSGYLARAAFLMDRPLRFIGLSGRAFIPMLLGFGCTVPAVMSARGMRSQRDRRLTVLLTPFMSCGAKMPIYALLTSAFFPKSQPLMMAGLYGLGVLVAAAVGFTLGRKVFHGAAEPFLMELPAYRLPTARSVLRQLGERTGDFIKRAFTVVFVATVCVWAMNRFTFRLSIAPDSASSMLGTLAGGIAPLLVPAGFGSVPAATALLTGLLAKESVVSTLAVLCGTQTMLASALHGVFPSALSAAAFLVFTLLYSPCVAALAAMRRELESRRLAVAAAFGQTALAWCAATALYQLGRLLGLG